MFIDVKSDISVKKNTRKDSPALQDRAHPVNHRQAKQSIRGETISTEKNRDRDPRQE